MAQFSKIISISRIALVAALIATPALASTSYDGQWSVRISSSRPDCPSGASLSIAIAKGQIASGGGVFNASGRVGDAGNIRVSMSSGLKRAVGSGRLSGNSGSGTWHGETCSGTWTAQRS